MDGSGHFLHRNKGVTQGGPLATIVYGIGVLLLISELCTVHPNVMKPWYADVTGVGGTFYSLQEHMRDLLVRGPPWGYFPETTKSILVVYPQNVQQEEEHFHGMGVQVVTGSCYLGGFISDQNSEKA